MRHDRTDVPIQELMMSGKRTVIEICAGAGGQALGLELAGFEHLLAVELDPTAGATLSHNRPTWDVRIGDVADTAVWDPAEYAWSSERDPDQASRVTLLAGGVPCPPFSIAGKQLGAEDERDLFAWAVELVGKVRPKAVLLENVRGLSMPRFAGYRQQIKDRLASFGYWSDWKLLEARDYGVPQLRPRFILVALPQEEARFFEWPEPTPCTETVGSTLRELMGANGWAGAETWANKADSIAPTIVGGSKKHGGADLGPTRAKRAWAAIHVDAMGVADDAPPEGADEGFMPKLTTEMVARIQGWGPGEEYAWEFTGRKTSRYRQIGNAFPPPVARAVGKSIIAALEHRGKQKDLAELEAEHVHDPVYLALRQAECPLSLHELRKASGGKLTEVDVEHGINLLSRDFVIDVEGDGDARTYRFVRFKGFVGQENHQRHLAFTGPGRSRIS
ncbi:DNA cytosine methyltransferase [Promicromonospora sp. NPDC060271]|uniref:DNA cytosine methyltransferase n=1 Tax=Promicromonospora sp. NPDC060271 TaxID=3347089 RepID=UPI00364ED1C4